MSDKTAPARKDHGPRLAAYVRSLLAPGQSMRSFCLEHGIDNARGSAWESSPGDVSIDRMRELANALGLTLGQVMVIAGYGTPDDFGGATPPEPTAPVVSIDVAIDHDPELSEFARRSLREILSSLRVLESGTASAVRKAGAGAVKATPRRRRGSRT